MSNKNNHRQILEQLAAGTINVDQAETMLFDADNKHFRMTDRGAVAVLGVQRRALVLFPTQWRQLNNRMAQLMKYIDHNIKELKTRQDNYSTTQPQATSATTTEEEVVLMCGSEAECH